MLAAHAVRLHGFRPDILSIPRKSVLSGAIYLHEPIPYLTSDVKSDIIKYVKLGTEEGYAEKVYGRPEADTSWDLYDGEFQAYSMKQAYDLLWIKYAHLIKDVDLARHSTPEVITQDYHLVISTIPALHICMYKDVHEFVKVDIWVSDLIPINLENNTIAYNGDLNDSWYRASRIFGVASTEFSFGAITAEDFPPSASKGVKPIENTCTCNPRFHRVGRFGQWRKGVLAHEAFKDTMEIMDREGIVDALF